jgi:DNA-binding MarR family transcriptional regulator
MVLPAAAEEIVGLFHGINRTLGRRVSEQMKPADLPAGCPLVLHLVHDRPGLTVSALSRAAGQAKSRTSVIVDWLADRGILDKRADPDDQRLVRVYATPRVEALWHGMHRMMEDMMAELLADLDPEQRANLVAALRQLRAAAQRKGWWKE